MSRGQLVALLRTALVVALAGFLGWVLGDALGIGAKFVAISAVVVAQATSLGKSLIRTRRRVLGTIVGVVFGGIALWLLGSGPWQMLAAIFAAFVAAGLLGLGEGARVAALGALAVVIAPVGGPAYSAMVRFADIVLGALIALVLGLIIYPRRASPQVVRGLAEVPARLAEALDPLVGRAGGFGPREREVARNAISTLREQVSELAPLIRQSDFEPGARHRQPTEVAEALQELLAASDAVVEQRSKLSGEGPAILVTAARDLGQAVCLQLLEVSAAIARGVPVPAFPDGHTLSRRLYEATEQLASDATVVEESSLREEVRAIAFSAELRRLSHLVADLEGLAIEDS